MKALVGTFKQEKAFIRAFSGDCKIFPNHRLKLYVQFVASEHMEARYSAKMRELGDCRHQIVFHGTDERANVDSILGSGFDKSRVKRVRRGLSPAWTSSSFDKVNSKNLFIHLPALYQPQYRQGFL